MQLIQSGLIAIGRMVACDQNPCTVKLYLGLFGLFMPYGGSGEAVIGLVGALFLTAVTMWHSRPSTGCDMACHHEWWIRAFAVGWAISTVRLVGIVVGLVLTPGASGYGPILVLSLWTDWAMVPARVR